jgi:hypothetical protein
MVTNPFALALVAGGNRACAARKTRSRSPCRPASGAPARGAAQYRDCFSVRFAYPVNQRAPKKFPLLLADDRAPSISREAAKYMR